MSKTNEEVSIVKLEFPTNIRTRQGMYGSDGTNANILFREVVDNSVDVVTKTRQSVNIKSITNRLGWNAVMDTGMGIPVYLDTDYPDLDQPITVDLLSKINIGSNFKKTEYSSGMNGVGLKLTNALSDNFIVMVNLDKKDANTLPVSIQEKVKLGCNVFIIKFEKGILQGYDAIPITELANIEEIKGNKYLVEFLSDENIKNFGSIVLFKPDSTMLDSTSVSYHGYPFKLIKGLFQYDKDFSNINVNFSINGEEIEAFNFNNYFYEDKLIENKVFTCSTSIKTECNLPIKFIFQVAWSLDKFNTLVDGSVNLLKTPYGKHITVVQTAIARALHKYNNIVNSQDSKLGMRLFVLNFAVDPLFNSQDKTKLSKWEDTGYNESELLVQLTNSFGEIINANKEYFDILCQRIIEYKKLANKLSNLDLLKTHVIMGDEGDRRRVQSGIMADVYECTSKAWDLRELYIVEGKSASSNLIAVRNKMYQSILPLRGKLINTSGFDEQMLVNNREVLAVINTIGCGIGGITDVSKSRYGKIIISTDADADGAHISNLIIGLFLLHAPDLIKKGYVYKLITPYYKVETSSGPEYYYYDEKHKVDFSKKVIKLKGLGSSSREETEKFMVNSSTRRLISINWDEEYDSEIFEASKLLFSGVARKQLMEELDIIES